MGRKLDINKRDKNGSYVYVALQKALSYPEVKEFWDTINVGSDYTAFRYLYVLGDMRENMGDLNNVSILILQRYLSNIRASKKPSTYNLHRSVASNYFFYFKNKGFPNPKDKVRFPYADTDRDAGVFTASERQAIRDYIKVHDNPVLYMAVFELLDNCPRLGEVLYLYRKHLNQVEGVVNITKTPHYTPKRYDKNYPQFIKLGETALKAVNDWVKLRFGDNGVGGLVPADKKDEPLLFLDNRMLRYGKQKNPEKCRDNWLKPLKESDIKKWFKGMVTELGMPDKHIHQLRSAYITDRLTGGDGNQPVSVYDVMISSGHKSARSLDAYVRIKEHKARVMNNPARG